jgi:hypothetical protein
MLSAAMHDKGLQRDIKQACFEDVLWWFNTMCWCFEPRSLIKIRPFLTWPHQDPAILQMEKAITDSEEMEESVDVVVDKSRGQGATWMYLLVILRRWLRDEMFSAGLVTRNEKLVDSMRDPDTLMWKVVWMIKMLPSWMLPAGFEWSRCRNLAEHSLLNPETGSSIVGYSATGDVARGGRKTLFVLDELAAFKTGEDYAALNSTAHVTNCRFLVSTYLGDSGAYFDAATQEGTAIKIILDWKDNPTQNSKLYRYIGGKVVQAPPCRSNKEKLNHRELTTIKNQHAQLRRRGFRIEDKMRNIWYNSQCLRPGSTPHGIAQELDRDPKGSVAKVFDGVMLIDAEQECVRPPLREGRLVYDLEKARVVAPYLSDGVDGEMKLWTQIGLDGSIPSGLYVIGIDISAGSGGSYSSNSVCCIINKLTGEQVGEFASNTVPPPRFAKLCAALGRWFHNAKLIPEANFGAGFMNVLIEDLAYENVYYRKVEIVGVKKETRKPGFWMANDEMRAGLLNRLQVAIAERAFTPRSKALVSEMPEYEWRNGKVVHVGSTKVADESSRGKAHGDRVIAAALAWLECVEEPILLDDDDRPVVVPHGSMAHRLRAFDELHDDTSDPWDDRNIDIFTSKYVKYQDDWR